MKDMTGKKDRETAAKGAVLHVRGGRCGIAALLCALFAFYFVMNLLSPLAADDFSYALSYVDGSKVTSLGGAVRSMAAHYRVINGRIVVHFFATIFMMLPKWVFDLCNTCMILLLNILICMHIEMERHFSAGMLIVVATVCWLLLPVWGHTVFFLTGACNYLWPMVYTLALLLWLRKLKTDTPMVAGVGFFLGLIAGALNEMASGVFLLSCTLMIGIALHGKRIVRKTHWMMIVGCILGFAFMVMAPGNRVRIAGSNYSIGNLVSLFLVYTERWLCRFLILVAPVVLLLLGGSKPHITEEDLIIPLFFLVCSLASNYAMLLSGQYPPRAQFTYAVYLVLAFGALYAKILPGLLTDTALRVLAGFCVLVFLAHASGTLNDFGAVYLQDRARVESARAQQAAGITDVVVDPIDPRSAYSSLSIGDLTEDPEHWINRGYRLYYGFPSVRIP